MSRVVLSDAARVDRREITADTVERFELAQARRLCDRFKATLDTLAESPLISWSHEELDPPGRSLRDLVVMKRLIIVDEATGEGIRVTRLLHGAKPGRGTGWRRRRRGLIVELGRPPGAAQLDSRRPRELDATAAKSSRETSVS